MIPGRRWLLLACSVSLSCGPEVFPPGLLALCHVDADCRAPFHCLLRPGMLRGLPPPDGVSLGVCSLPCATRADCPTVRNQHCGELTQCTQRVCDYDPCD